jgi:hypothetical protein
MIGLILAVVVIIVTGATWALLGWILLARPPA